MNSADICKVLERIAALLEAKGENPFKVRAYRQASETVKTTGNEIMHIAEEGRLGELPGFGEALSKKVTELVKTGHLEYYERLVAEFPEGMIDLMDIPGIGPKTALRLAGEYGLKSKADLEIALHNGKLDSVPDIGAKTLLKLSEQLKHKQEQSINGGSGGD